MAHRTAPEHVPPRHRRPGDDARGPSRRRRAARRTVQLLPTAFTLANLWCGCAAIFVASRPPEAVMLAGWSPLTWAAIFIFAGMAMDALDGRVARMTRNTSDLGEQLDSMSDMVTFGVAPAFMAVRLVVIGEPFLAESAQRNQLLEQLTVVVAVTYASFAALRLARFNVEVDQPQEADHNSFKGLPSPGAAGTVASLVLLHQHFLAHHERIGAVFGGGGGDGSVPLSVALSKAAIVGITLLVALAMISRIRYVHAANRLLRKRATIGKLAAMVVILLLFTLRLQWSLAIAFTAYALSGPVMWIWGRRGRAPQVTGFVPADAPAAHDSSPPERAATGEAGGREVIDPGRRGRS